jgi:hypothetical protein
VQRLLREQGVRFVQNVWQPGAPQPAHQPPEDAEAAEEVAEREPRTPPRRGSEPEDDQRPLARQMVAPAPAGMAREHLQKLRAALDDLAECRKLLDAALGS